jgi:hypothetical protein
MKRMPPLIAVDKTVVREDNVKEYWTLTAFEGPGGLHFTGSAPGPARADYIAERLAAAQKRGR